MYKKILIYSFCYDCRREKKGLYKTEREYNEQENFDWLFLLWYWADKQKKTKQKRLYEPIFLLSLLF